MTTFDKLYIDGAWVAPAGTDTLEVIDSTTEEVYATIPAGTPADIDRAVAAAKAAFPVWSETSAPERAKLLLRVAEELEARKDELADIISHEVGMPIGLSKMIQAGLPTANFGAYAAIVKQFAFEEKVGSSLVVREPIGVVGCITPWNYPLHQIAAKVAPALAVGCTVVLKPSEVAPINAFIFAEICHEVGLPKGVELSLHKEENPVVATVVVPALITEEETAAPVVSSHDSWTYTGVMVRLVLGAALAVSVLPTARGAAPAFMPLPLKVSPATGRLPIDSSFTIGTTGCADPRVSAAAGRITQRILRQTGLPVMGGPAVKLAVECAAPGFKIRDIVRIFLCGCVAHLHIEALPDRAEVQQDRLVELYVRRRHDRRVIRENLEPAWWMRRQHLRREPCLTVRR